MFKKIMALLMISTVGCAAMQGRSKLDHDFPKEVKHRHDHRGGAIGPSIQTLYVENGLDKSIYVTVECPLGGNSVQDYPVLPRQSQGFAEWNGECSFISYWIAP